MTMNADEARKQAAQIVDTAIKGRNFKPEPTPLEREMAIKRVSKLLAWNLLSPAEQRSRSPPIRFDRDDGRNINFLPLRTHHCRRFACTIYRRIWTSGPDVVHLVRFWDIGVSDRVSASALRPRLSLMHGAECFGR